MNENANKNLDENLDVEMAAASKNENQILDENASQTLGETEQNRENLQQNIKKSQIFEKSYQVLIITHLFHFSI